jgi:hypothetical protein
MLVSLGAALFVVIPQQAGVSAPTIINFGNPMAAFSSEDARQMIYNL